MTKLIECPCHVIVNPPKIINFEFNSLFLSVQVHLDRYRLAGDAAAPRL